MHITFIQTGGTIDKDYPKISSGYAFEFGEPATERILRRLYPSFEFDILTAFQKDSLDIKVQDRAYLVQLIKERSAHRVIITHGTDTLISTGNYLKDKIGDKLVVLTGAMRPERFYNSDAAINLGCAIGAANILESGVYVAMHGIVKPAAEMSRNLETGQFG